MCILQSTSSTGHFDSHGGVPVWYGRKPLVGGGTEISGQFFSMYSIFYYCNLLVYRWNWIFKGFSKKSLGKCLFSVILSILARIFVLFTVFYLFPPPNTLLSCYYYQIICLDIVAIHVLSICHQDTWKKSLGFSCLLDFRYFCDNFWHFSVYSSRFYPMYTAKLMLQNFTYHTEHLITLE